MFRQAAMMMSPAKATSAGLARNSPTPTKVGAALRALCSPSSSATKRMASTSPSAKNKAAAGLGTKSSPKKLAFDAEAAAKTKAAMRSVAAAGASPKQKAASAWKQTAAALAKTSATESAVSSALRSVCASSPQKSASKKALSSRSKKKATTARCSPKSSAPPKKNAPAVVTPKGSSKKEMAKKAAEFMGDDLTDVDFEAAASIMDTLKTEVLHPVDPVAVNLFGGATPATATAHALMVVPPQETSLTLSLGVEALLNDTAAAATSIDDVVLEIPFAESGSESAVATEALELAAQEIAPEGIIQAPAAAAPILPNTTATTRGANAASFALYDSIMSIVGDIIRVPEDTTAAAAAPAAPLGSEYPQHVIENRCPFQSPVHHMPMKI